MRESRDRLGVNIATDFGEYVPCGIAQKYLE